MSLAEKHLQDFRIRGGEVVARHCPFCQGGDSGDEYTFAIGLYNGAYSCLRGGCGVKGSFRDLCNFFGERTDPGLIAPRPMPQKQKTYVRPESAILHPLTEQIITYFGVRKISQQTLEDFLICADDKGNIVFPFNRDGVLTYVKYRRPAKYIKGEGPKEWQMSQTEPILFGMDLVSVNKPLIITEGEIDALSLYEAGCRNVVSVPCGCSNLEWVSNCWDWLEQFSQIILFGDNDEPGMEMVQNLMKRLGEDRCMIPPPYPDLMMDGKHAGRLCKDANEILYSYGAETLKSIVDACEPAPVKGILNLADVRFIDPALTPRIFTRIPALDNAIGGLAEGGVTIFSGKRGEGKSTLNGQLLLNAIQQGHNVCAYSGELSAQKFLEWIMLQATESKYIEAKTDPRSGRVYAMVPQEIQNRIKEWIDGKFFLFDNGYVDGETQEEAILKVFTVCARRYNCKLFLADNLMTVTSSCDEENKAQARFTAALKKFAVKYNVHVILIAHPRKTKAGETFSSDDVSGSSAITNLADNVINIEKPHIRITKNRDNGILDYITCSYDPCNRRIFQTSYGDRTMYAWNHEGISIPENQAQARPEFTIQGGEASRPPAYPC